MEITNQEFLNIWNIINELVNAEIPSYAGSCRIEEVFELMKFTMKTFFEFRDNLYKEYFTIDEKTGIVQKIKDESKLDEFNSKLNDLMLMTRDIDTNDYKIKLSYLKDIKLLLKNKKGAIIDKIFMPPMYRIVMKKFIENDIKE